MDDLPIGAQMREYPIDEMLVSLAKGLVKAQWELNQSAIDALRLAAEEKITLPDDTEASLLSLGLSPSFYKFDQLTIDLSIEMAMYMEDEAALAIGASVEGGNDGGEGKSSVAVGASIDVSMSRKYGVDMNAATHLSATISAIEPPAALLEAFSRGA